MAESKSALLAKSVQKHAGRAKEKLLQNLGKVDRTADEIFDEHLTNFNRQQINANRLQKEFNNYIRCIRAVQTASKSLMDAICDVYENQWTGAEALHAQVSAIEVLWQDFSHKLGDQVLIPLNTYTAQFPEMKKKIEKRNRKLIDYDSQRHSFQNLQANAAKRKDDVKITKGREQLEEARRTYELLNSELHDELPALHDSRILFLVTNLQTLFASEQVFHNETNKIYAELEAIVDKLATESQRGSYTLKKSVVNSTPSSPAQSPVKAIANSTSVTNNSYPSAITNGSSNANSPSSMSSSPIPEDHQQHDHHQQQQEQLESLPSQGSGDVNTPNENEPSYQNTAAILSSSSLLSAGHDDINNKSIIREQNNTNANIMIEKDHDGNDENVDVDDGRKISTGIIPLVTSINAAGTATTENLNGNIEKLKTSNEQSATINAAASPAAGNNSLKLEELYDVPVGATTTDLPPGVLYRVKATYRYIKEDVDELSFEVGDIIRVVEYDDPEDQEEGWLTGVKEGTTEKGLFPANFTRPL